MSDLILITVMLAAGGSGSESGFLKFYNEWLNIPGFELWKFFNLAIFVGILTYLLKKPLTAAFKAKRESIRAELIRAEEEKQAALAKLASTEAKLTQLESERSEVLKRASAEAESEKERITRQTEAEVQRLREQAEAEIGRMAQVAKAELRRISAEESVRRAEAKIKAAMDANKDSRLVKASIDAIGGLN